MYSKYKIDFDEDLSNKTLVKIKNVIEKNLKYMLNIYV